MSRSLDFLGHLRSESARFGVVLAAADPLAAVPSCPDWHAADLLWHLTEVQHFWGTIVRDRLTDPDPADDSTPGRPTDCAELLELYSRTSAALSDALATTPDETPAWTWSEEQTVGFIRRRQAHEALIHRLDAELTVGAVTAFDPALASDGADEALRLMYGRCPGWATFIPGGGTGRVISSDTGDQWDFEIGRFRGTSPGSGKTYDDAVLQVSSGPLDAPSFIVRGASKDLDAWLWNRPTVADLEVAGDPAAYEQFRLVVSEGVQ